MASHTKVDVSLITDFQGRYFRGFPCIPAWHQSVEAELKQTGRLTTLFGRQRHFFGRPEEASTLRKAVAYEPQSMTADEIDTGIIQLWRFANANPKLGIQLLMQVHDSILFQYPEHLEDEVIPAAKEALRTTLELKNGRKFTVPVDAQVGWNWGKAKASNPGGLVKWLPSRPDTRTRPDLTPPPAPARRAPVITLEGLDV